MNKMERRELVNVLSKEKQSVSFFEDDNIETVREQLAKSANSHHDRMFILVSIKFAEDYYTADPRNWNNLFNRLSYNGRTIEKSTFDEYQTNYRFPNTRVIHKSYDIEEWMSYPPELKPIFAPTNVFAEYRILGVAEKKSFILPFDGSSKYLSRIPAVDTPIPQNTILLSTLYSVKNIDHFAYKVYDPADEDVIQYYPLLRSGTPTILSDESVLILEKNAKLLNELLDLKLPKEAQHSSVHILRTRFYVPWVDTDFGSAIRTRFEQIFYGLTVSKDIPYIGFFTSDSEINRHKFFTEDVKTKVPYLEMPMWKTWWSMTKPARNRPTLLLYRGTSKHNFDRILITSVDMIISSNRPEDCKDTPEELKKSCEKWLRKFDALIPFLDEKDIHPDRWELQDMTVFVSYPKPIDELSLLRFNCVSSVYAATDKKRSLFTILRTDHSNFGVTSVEARLVQMSQEGPLDIKTVAQEFSITTDHASKLINDITARREENDRLGDRLFQGYPTIIIGPNFVRISLVREIGLAVKYADILRYILSTPDSKELDKICPPRMQTISSETATISTSIVDHDAVVDESFADLLEDFGEEQEEPEKDTEKIKEVPLGVANQPATIYNYFKNRLKSFDPETYVDKSDYPKKCEQKRQPVVLNPDDKKRLEVLEDGEYDPVKDAPEEKLLEVDDPPGTLVCPEYWCMKDEIPLREDQLVSEDGTFKCPLCRGKLQTSSNVDLREYPLIKRDTGFVFPRLTSYKSPANEKNMPCCYKKARSKKPEKDMEVKDKYYVFIVERRNLPELRMAKLPKEIIDLLFLKEAYSSLNNERVPENVGGYFRIGLGHSANTLPTILGMSQTIPSPRESPATVAKCSFMRTWLTPTETHSKEIYDKLDIEDTIVREHISRIISGIDDAFTKKELSPIQEIEYCALALQCDIFRIDLKTFKVGCVLYASMVRPRTRGIIILQNNNEIDILAYARRSHNTFVYKSNIFEEPFPKITYRLMEATRNESCSSEIPTYTDAVSATKKMFDEKYSVILDPYGRGQAIYIPDKLVLPFQSTPLPDTEETRVWGYTHVDRLPSFDDMKLRLKEAEKSTKGYEYQDAIYNSNGLRVEILVSSGLRVPVKPEKVGTGDVRDTVPTVKELGETDLAFGEASSSLKKVYDDISYNAEVYDFLVFQLSSDLQHDQYADLRNAMREHPPKRQKLEPMLKKWFDRITQFTSVKNSQGFISKIRTPCGQFAESKCTGNLCGWDGKVCRIQIKKTVNEEKLFTRLFSAVFGNSKIRAMILDGRTTPFFSTILYIELPHELIVTDKQL
jgi:hypothetical protein